jgi:putative salt-induced outer membrane protein YdiY
MDFATTRTRLVQGVAGLVVAFGLAATASAQPPAPAAAPAPPPPPVEGSGEVAFVNTAGNAESTSLGLRGEVLMRPDTWLLKTRAAFVRLESEDELEAQSFTFFFRGERPLSPKLSAFGQYDYLRDLFAGIEHKNVVSGGLSYKAIATDRHTLVFDGGVGVSDERRLDAEDVTAAVLLGGIGYKLKISTTTELTEDVRYEQSLDEGDEWRLDNAVAIVTKINSIFSLKVSNVIRYANAPVIGFETTDTVTSVALVAKF